MFYSESKVETTPEQDKAELAYAQAWAYQAELNATSDGVTRDKRQLIQNELDSIFPYMGQQVYVSGNGVYPVCDVETGEVLDEIHGFVSGQQGLHVGFFVAEINEGSTLRYQVLQQIALGQVKSKPCLTVDRQETISTFVDLDASVLLISDINNVYNPDSDVEDDDFHDRIERMLGMSKELTGLYKSTTFRRMRHAKQLRTVMDFLINADRETRLRNVGIMTEAEYAYTPSLSDGWRLIPLLIEKTLIEGTIVGLDSTESVTMKAKAIRNNDDLLDKNAGLCLVIDPTEESKDVLSLSANSVVLLPTASQEFEIALNA